MQSDAVTVMSLCVARRKEGVIELASECRLIGEVKQ
jgi:hypothetical protein